MELVLARSLAGHDKGSVYVVLGTDDEDVLLVDGKRRSVEEPKRKRLKHVQRIVHFPAGLALMVQSAERWTDELVRQVLRSYVKSERSPG